LKNGNYRPFALKSIRTIGWRGNFLGDESSSAGGRIANGALVCDRL